MHAFLTETPLILKSSSPQIDYERLLCDKNYSNDLFIYFNFQFILRVNPNPGKNLKKNIFGKNFNKS
jgi:hypothetical protein